MTIPKHPVRYDKSDESLIDADNNLLLQIAFETNREYHDTVCIDLGYIEKAINFYEENKHAINKED